MGIELRYCSELKVTFVKHWRNPDLFKLMSNKVE